MIEYIYVNVSDMFLIVYSLYIVYSTVEKNKCTGVTNSRELVNN